MSLRMRTENLLPPKDDDRVRAFCSSISPGGIPLYVPVRPEPGFLAIQCLTNVPRKVVMSGGEVVRGWEISQVPKMFLEARFHAVWKTPAGDYVDVTPEDFGMSQVLFLPDVRYRDTEPAVQRHRFSLAQDKAAVERYWFVADELLSLMQSDAWGAIRADDPAMQSHISGLQKEARMIRQRLQK
jgi:hypothetical protein